MLLTIYKDSFKFKTEQTKDTENRKTKKKGFVKEQVENADLYKSVMNKIMTKHE